MHSSRATQLQNRPRTRIVSATGRVRNDHFLLTADHLLLDVNPASLQLDRMFTPRSARDPLAGPATNREIAGELVLSLDAVKSHLRELFRRFELDALPQNHKRARLLAEAFDRGAISLAEL